MEQAKRLVVYCNKSDLHILKRFYKRKKFKAEIVDDIQVEQGLCLFDFKRLSTSNAKSKRSHRRRTNNFTLFFNAFNKSILKRCCNINIITDSGIDDISINYFTEIEG